MPNHNGVSDASILESALIGLQQQQSEIESKISDIRRTLGIRAPRQSSAARPRKMSRSARQRIAAAQKKRWAAYRRAAEPVQKESTPAAPKKRRLSAAARKRIAEATRKRWAAYRAKKASTAKKTGRRAVSKAA